MKNFPKIVWSWLKEKLGFSSRHETVPAPDSKSVRDFEQIIEVAMTPSNSDVKEDQLLAVVHKGKVLWTLFRCPCGCDDVVSLPMQPPKQPRWRIDSSPGSPPSLYPSVWRSKGCFSHFYITDGRVIWCSGTGLQPWIARPDIYSEPKSRY